MIDIHSHILPGIDDGANSIEETINMIQEAYQNGVEGIISTSHYLDDRYIATKDERNKLIESLKELLEIKKIPISLYNGAEVYISSNIIENITNGNIPTINNSKYLLFELPMNTEYLGLENIIRRLKDLRIVPILAHPERYSYVRKNLNVLCDLIEEGILMQSNIGSFCGKYGSEAKKAVIKMAKHNMIHLLGTDCHREKDIYANLNHINKEIIRDIGKDKWKEYTSVNPTKIVQNKEITVVPPIKINKHFGIFF